MKIYCDQDADLNDLREWILGNQANRPVFNGLRRIEAEHPIEEVGKKLRGLMSRLNK